MWEKEKKWKNEKEKIERDEHNDKKIEEKRIIKIRK